MTKHGDCDERKAHKVRIHGQKVGQKCSMQMNQPKKFMYIRIGTEINKFSTGRDARAPSYEYDRHSNTHIGAHRKTPVQHIPLWQNVFNVCNRSTPYFDCFSNYFDAMALWM